MILVCKSISFMCKTNNHVVRVCYEWLFVIAYYEVTFGRPFLRPHN